MEGWVWGCVYVKGDLVGRSFSLAAKGFSLSLSLFFFWWPRGRERISDARFQICRVNLVPVAYGRCNLLRYVW